MSSLPIKKRKYVRLVESDWSEIRSLWEVGDSTLAELAYRYGVSVRTLQSHFEKHASEKGSAAQAMAATVKTRILDQGLASEDVITSRALATREAGYANAVLIEDLIMAQLEIAQKDPSAAFKAAAAVKMLSLAAGTIERLHATKRSALGLRDDDDGRMVELPAVVFRVLSPAEAQALHREGDDDNEGDEIGISEDHPEDGDDDDIIIEE
jgi:hypothetical protein